MKRILKAVVLLLLAPVVGLGVLYLTGGYVKKSDTWWYPFVTSFLSDYYVTGPFAMTSNTREDNPVWQQIPALNDYQARLTYAMSRGKPKVEVAWLLAEAEWPDRPAIGEDGVLNGGESALSRALVAEGIDYHRISRNDLVRSTVEVGRLLVGEANFGALLVDDLSVAEPELLRAIARTEQAGIPVVWLGEFPHRAPGWRDAINRDQSVARLSAALAEKVAITGSPADAALSLRALGLGLTLQPLSESGTGGLRITGREIDRGEILMLFNESNKAVSARFGLQSTWQDVQVLDPAVPESLQITGSSGNLVDLEVPPGRVRLLLLQQTQRDIKGYTPAADSADSWDWNQWRKPARKFRPMMRWWWPGNDVERDELRRELQSLHDAGYGGVEIQTLTIGLSQAHLETQEASIYGVGTGTFFENLKYVFGLARELEMAVDLTLGSGWSSGGPFVDDFPEQQLLRAHIDVEGPVSFDEPLPSPEEPWYALPSNLIIRNTIGDFDANTRLEAAVLAKLDAAHEPARLSDFADVSHSVENGALKWEVPKGRHRIFALYQNDTAHNVVASAYPGALIASPVLDHLHPGGAGEYLTELGDPWLDAIAPFTPRSVFVDSFELIGELPWSTIFSQRFLEMHGYEVTPFLPLLFMDRGESKYVNVVIPPRPAYEAADEMGQRIREDYEIVRQQLFLDSFVKPVSQWAASKGIQLRLQAHGGYGDYLDTYQVADVPEAEGLFAGGSYDFLKLAASAAHVAGRRFVSSESFITLTTDFNALEIEDYYRLAGNAYAAGINVTVCHGYAYHYVH